MTDFSPREIVSELDRYIVGQKDAKRAVAIALRNRWRRQQLQGQMREEVLPKNILMDNQVPEDVKSERLAELQALVSSQQKAFNASRLGMVCDVLLEKKGRNAGQIVGKSPWLQPVQLDASEDLIGSIQAVEIVEIGSNSLFGQLIDGQNAYEKFRPAQASV